MSVKITSFGEKNFEELFKSAVDELKSDNIIERIWNKDHTVWRKSEKEISNRLGWLDSPDEYLTTVDEIKKFVELAKADGIKDVLLLGMGGSSLAPEVFRLMFGVESGYPEVTVLDSTHPENVIEYANRFDPETTLYIVSTKSGGTVETLSFMKYFYNQALNKLGKEKAGKHFTAITDPGSKLQDLASDLRFRKTFINNPNIGGRYSALSFFGQVPAALVGIDVRKLLENARSASKECAVEDPENNDTARLGAFIGKMAKEGRDKLTFIMSNQLAYFGAWVEQLIAESLGKEGKGVLPVVDESLEAPEHYAPDRMFVYMKLKSDTNHDDKVEALRDAGFSVITIELDDVYDMGAEFFKWEFATAVAGWQLDVHPFDQPNVESAKIKARKMVKKYQDTGGLPELIPDLKGGDVDYYGSTKAEAIEGTIDKFLLLKTAGDSKTGKDRSYVAIQAYLNPASETTAALQKLRTAIQKKYQIACTVGYGPRFLHSTGQLHKGDAGNGLFIQITDEPQKDADIPDEPAEPASHITFGVLIKAQALGDRQALLDNKRNLIRYSIKGSTEKVLERLTEFV